MNDYKNYAIAAAYFIISRLDDKIKKTQETKLRSSVNKIVEEFYTSTTALQFKLKGIDNKINCIVGKLAEWKDLKRSMISTGIVLYGNYKSGIEKKELEQHFIMSWEAPKARGAFLNKLYGYSVGKKRYAGMIKKFDSEKIGKSAIMLPSQHKDKFMQLMEKYNANYQMIEVYR